eukprot:924914_1
MWYNNLFLTRSNIPHCVIQRLSVCKIRQYRTQYDKKPFMSFRTEFIRNYIDTHNHSTYKDNNISRERRTTQFRTLPIETAIDQHRMPSSKENHTIYYVGMLTYNSIDNNYTIAPIICNSKNTILPYITCHNTTHPCIMLLVHSRMCNHLPFIYGCKHHKYDGYD